MTGRGMRIGCKGATLIECVGSRHWVGRGGVGKLDSGFANWLGCWPFSAGLEGRSEECGIGAGWVGAEAAVDVLKVEVKLYLFSAPGVEGGANVRQLLPAIRTSSKYMRHMWQPHVCAAVCVRACVCE